MKEPTSFSVRWRRPSQLVNRLLVSPVETLDTRSVDPGTCDGTSVKAVAARLGHSDPIITLRTYAHVMPHEETAAAERLGALLSTEAG
jgi:transcriptional accessory protein Tex/SPT6